MRISGIYKITNLVNEHFYIGQSRDIYTRWKSHTLSINDNSSESAIRMAFAKHGLRNQVSKEGVFGNFKFEIIELCQEEKLLERECYYINKLNPPYNVMLLGTNPHFPKRDTQKAQNFLQYHSFEKMGYLPGDSDDNTVNTDNLNYGIYTKKRVAINMLGASVILIVGLKFIDSQKNRYYLWSELTVEDVQFDPEYQDYIVQGIENIMSNPIDLTDLEGFDEFRMKCGNFAYGLQSMKNKNFYHTVIVPLLSKNRIQHTVNYNQWIEDFITREEAKFVKSSI